MTGKIDYVLGTLDMVFEPSPEDCVVANFSRKTPLQEFTELVWAEADPTNDDRS